MLKKNLVPVDTVLMSVLMVIIGLGLAMLLSSSFMMAERNYGNPYFFFFPQLRHAVLGLMIIVIMMNIPYQLWMRLAWPIVGITIILLVLVMIPGLSKVTNGAGRWLGVGGLKMQPSELVKLAVVIYMARSLSQKGDMVKTFYYGFLPHVLVLSIFGILINLERDLGGAMVVSSIIMIMLFVAGLKIIYFVFCGIIAVPVVWSLISVFDFRYRVNRIQAWLDPWSDPQNTGYAIIHSFYAFANGGIFGVGPGGSQQKLFFLPEAHTDYIFSIVGEELGLIGVALVAGLFLFLAVRGFLIARSSRDLGGFYMAMGMTLVIVVPAFLNMAVALSLLPAKGLPLPFFSYGGSSYLVSSAAMGILLNVSGQSKKSEAPQVRVPLKAIPAVAT